MAAGADQHDFDALGDRSVPVDLTRISRQIKAYFLTGLIAVLPLLLTIFVVKWVAGTLNLYIGPSTVAGRVLQSIGYKFSPISNLTLAYCLGILLLLIGIFILGVLLESGARRTLTSIAQRTVYQLPLVRAIYRTTDKFVNLMPSGDTENLKGMRVVYLRFGNSEISPGTLALMPSMERFKIGDRDHWIVIVPTAPIPVGGAMLFAPVETVFSTDMTIDAFAGSFVSLGVSTAPFQIGGPVLPDAMTPDAIDSNLDGSGSQ
jgi:uncharacterized membrane protein